MAQDALGPTIQETVKTAAAAHEISAHDAFSSSAEEALSVIVSSNLEAALSRKHDFLVAARAAADQLREVEKAKVEAEKAKESESEKEKEKSDIDTRFIADNDANQSRRPEVTLENIHQYTTFLRDDVADIRFGALEVAARMSHAVRVSSVTQEGLPLLKRAVVRALRNEQQRRRLQEEQKLRQEAAEQFLAAQAQQLKQREDRERLIQGRSRKEDAAPSRGIFDLAGAEDEERENKQSKVREAKTTPRLDDRNLFSSRVRLNEEIRKDNSGARGRRSSGISDDDSSMGNGVTRGRVNRGRQGSLIINSGSHADDEDSNSSRSINGDGGGDSALREGHQEINSDFYYNKKNAGKGASSVLEGLEVKRLLPYVPTLDKEEKGKKQRN